MKPDPGFAQKVWRFVKLKRTFFAGQAATFVGIACLALAAVVAGADAFLAFPPAARWTSFLVLLAVAVAGLVGRFVAPSLRFGSQQAISEIEHRRAELGQMLRTSAQVGPEEEAATAGFSPALVRALKQQADEELKRTDLNRLIPWPQVRKKGMVLLALVALFGGALLLWRDFRTSTQRLLMPAADLTFTRVEAKVGRRQFERGETIAVEATVSGRPVETAFLRLRPEQGEWETTEMIARSATRYTAEIPNRETSLECFVKAGDGRSRLEFVRFIDPPVVERLVVRVRYPQYTELPPQELENDDIVAVEGSTLELRFRTSHPLRQARLRIGKDQVLPAGLENQEAVVTHVIERGARDFFLQGQDDEELPLKKVVYRMRGMPDKLPEVKIEEPREDLEATKLTEIPVRVRAKDDYGLAEIGVVLKVDDREEILAGRLLNDEIVFAAQERTIALLENHSLDITSNVRLYAFARDRKPGEGRRGVSELRAIDVRPLRLRFRMKPPEEKQEGAEEERREQEENVLKLEDAIKEQRALLSKTFKLQQEGQKDAEEPKRLAEAEEELAERLDELQNEMAELAPPQAEQLLDQAAANMQQAAAELKKQDLAAAFEKEDAALADLLKLRQDLIQELMRQEEEQKKQQQEQPMRVEVPEDLDELAQEAERLAQEERDVREQLAQAAPQPAAQPDQPRQPAPEDAAQPPPAPAAADAGEQAEADAAQDAPAEAQADQQADAAQQAAADAGEQAQDAAAQDAPAEAQADQQADAAQQAQADAGERAQDAAAQDVQAEAQADRQADARQEAHAEVRQQEAQANAPQAPDAAPAAQDARADQQADPAQADADARQQAGEAQQAQAAALQAPAAAEAVRDAQAQAEAGQQRDAAQDAQAKAQADQQAQAAADAGEQADAQARQPDGRPPAEAMRQQEAAVADAADLMHDLKNHPEGTALALNRMEAIAQDMRQAAQAMRADAAAKAAPQLDRAQEKLTQLAEHLRGLDERNLAETLDAAKEKAQRAAERLAGRDQAPRQERDARAAAQQPGQREQQGDRQGAREAAAAAADRQQEDGQDDREAAAAAEQADEQEQGEDREAAVAAEPPQQDAQERHAAAARQARAEAARAEPRQAGNAQGERAPLPAPERERVAQDAETIADWLKQLQNKEMKGLGNMPERLGQIEEQVDLQDLAEDVRRSQEQRDSGLAREADRLDKQTAERFERLSQALAKEKQRLMQSHLERLAAAEAEANDLRQQAQEQQEARAESAKPSRARTRAERAAAAGAQAAPADAAERLEDLAEELKDLRDEQLEQLGEQLLEQVGPQNRRGRSNPGQAIPETVVDTTLTPAVERIKVLIDEIVQHEMLMNRDDRVPDKYARLVERYFKALSDDLQE